MSGDPKAEDPAAVTKSTRDVDLLANSIQARVILRLVAEKVGRTYTADEVAEIVHDAIDKSLERWH